MTARLVGRTGRVRGTDVAVSELLTVGSGPGNDLRIEARTVSRRHAQIVKTGSEYFIEDLGSRNSTFLNGQPVKRFPIRHLDVISIGPDADLIFMETGAAPAMARPASFRATISWINGPLEGQVEEIAPNRGLLLGRRPELPLTAISRKHAALTIKDNYVTVEDLGSANGTWVNGSPISTVTVLADGDEVALGNLVRCRVSVQSGMSEETRRFTEDTGQLTIVVDPTSPHARDRALEVPPAPGPAVALPAPEPAQAPPPVAPAMEPAPDQKSPAAAQESPADATMVAQREAPRPPAHIGVPDVPELPPVTDGTMVAQRGPAVLPSFGRKAPVENLNTFTPPREPVHGVPGAVASRALAARDATVAAPPGPDQEKPAVPVTPPPPAPAAETPAGARVVGARLDGAQDFTLELGTFHVGRHSDCEIRIEVRDLGRKHARLTVDAQAVTVEDLNSANGTFVGDERVTGRRVVPDGGRMRFATVEFTVTYLRGEE